MIDGHSAKRFTPHPGFIWLALLAVSLLAGCQQQPEQLFQGYAEGEYVMVASPQAGRLERLAVARGDQVAVGALLFSLDSTPQQSEQAAAAEAVRRAESLLADLEKGQRPSELEAIDSRLEQAKAALELSTKELLRRQQLFTSEAISREELDRAQSAEQRDRAAVAELEAQRTTARLGARRDAQAAARAELAAARARLRQADWVLAQQSPSAEQAALVADTFYVPGEFVPAGYPVVSLLPPENLKLRFFVPEPLLGSLRLGQRVKVSYDGAGEPLTATISYLSPQPEYTPPVIFSRETRAKLVFLVEARPEPEVAGQLHPGQPLEVRLDDTHD